MDDTDQESTMAAILGNMALAHEMIMSDNFQLKSFTDDPSSENSLEKQVHDIVHKAFWDVLEKDLTEEPPLYDNALKLLKEMKLLILELVKNNPKNPLYSQIQDGFDLDLIMQQIAHDAFNLLKFAEFVIDILSKLCAPVRDEKIEELRQVTDIVPLLRGVFELINTMKMDMANYEIKTIKPILMQQAVQYEKQKFAEYLKEKPDSLIMTTDWLKSAYERVKSLRKPNSPIKITPNLVITNAYLSLLNPKEASNYPETLHMDITRLQDMGVAYKQLTNLSIFLTLAFNYLGVHFSTDESFVNRLKCKLMVLMADTIKLNPDLLESISVQIINEGDVECEKKELAMKTDEQKDILKKQILELSDKENPLTDLIKSRIRDYVLLSMTSQNQTAHTPAVLQPIQVALKDTTVKYLRVIRHNRNVYSSYYDDIVKKFLQDEQSEEDEKEA